MVNIGPEFRLVKRRRSISRRTAARDRLDRFAALVITNAKAVIARSALRDEAIPTGRGLSSPRLLRVSRNADASGRSDGWRRFGSVSGEPPAPVPHPLFRLFYQAEIRRRRIPSWNIPSPLAAADLATVQGDCGNRGVVTQKYSDCHLRSARTTRPCLMRSSRNVPCLGY